VNYIPIKNLGLILLLLLGQRQVAVEIANYLIKPIKTEYQLVIKSSYKRSKKTWGTYDLHKETAKFSHNKELFKTSLLPSSNLILKSGVVYLTRPTLDDNGHTRYLVSTFPYNNLKSQKKIKVNIKRNETELYQLYKDQIESFLQRSRRSKKVKLVKADMVEFGSLNCSKSWKNINCHLPIIIKI
jgi:hypothetical protein